MTVLVVRRELTKAYGHRPLFAGLSLDLRAGERVGLIGPNGAGKSTLLRLLAGQEAPDAGALEVRRAACVGYVPQDDTFPPGLTAATVVRAALAGDPGEPHDLDVRAAAALTRAGFADPDVPVDALSGGWRKRLALARAVRPPARPTPARRAD